jgi:hypothetical protein
LVRRQSWRLPDTRVRLTGTFGARSTEFLRAKVLLAPKGRYPVTAAIAREAAKKERRLVGHTALWAA